jgi:hypothetical protein
MRFGLGVLRSRRTFMGNGSGVSRGDRKLSGTFTGRTRLTRQGRPGLRLAAWRAVWGAQRANPVYRARYQHLTGRQISKLKPAQAQTVIAAAILRHLHAVITTGQAWHPVIATLGKHRQALPAAA